MWARRCSSSLSNCSCGPPPAARHVHDVKVPRVESPGRKSPVVPTKRGATATIPAVRSGEASGMTGWRTTSPNYQPAYCQTRATQRPTGKCFGRVILNAAASSYPESSMSPGRCILTSRVMSRLPWAIRDGWTCHARDVWCCWTAPKGIDFGTIQRSIT
ncbi:uncharacterized protein LY79DRAFT_566262 [Colletotrichum navitas]|uniref:Uncharacterized protein n=1 Tax=Colletotrichum navitas TaxID=681940 RepID=A0AAD8PQ76_9PEZI|nr:uncharacterized protein LY79DRAFT_566262 [Colletotrichum navitas]KAK1574297.1 hypothetical protein LY79DRAFT_566262 [Colletotrichum navitas]